MERLTKRDSYGDVYVKQHDYVTASERIAECEGFEDFEEIFRKKMTDTASERLCEYEDLEEQGRLVKLPCKVGDDIYAIPSEVNYRLNKSFGAKGLNAICRQVVDHIEFNSYGYLVSTNEGMTVHRQEAFGETWFLTRNEAEQRLKEMNTDNGIAE